jgi:hypothetical protein
MSSRKMELRTYFPTTPCSAIPRKDPFEAAGLGGSNAPRFTGRGERVDMTDGLIFSLLAISRVKAAFPGSKTFSSTLMTASC